MKEKIFVFVDWYEPGFRGGGPIRSCVNFAENLKNDFEIFIFTRDRDLGMDKAYDHIQTDTWLQKDGINIFYGSPTQLTWSNIAFQLKENIQPAYIYVNGMFSKLFSIYPLLIKRFYGLKQRCIVTPRGMLKSTALQFKRERKTCFLKVLQLFNIYDHIIFQATDETEQCDVKRNLGEKSLVRRIPNFPAKPKDWTTPPLKKPGIVKLIFVGRTHPIKNLHLVLEWLPQTDGEILFTIITTDEDMTYWNKCKQLIDKFPSSIKTIVQKNVPHATVEKLIAEHHVLILPTEGENFGHVIFEALSLGRPVIISDQTPWRHLQQKKAGWDISLSETEQFIAALRVVLSWNQEELNDWSFKAWQLSVAYAENRDLKNQYLQLFSNQ
ncbi:MAG: glycosyltransferase family 4 protein [Agriterribacter sp.]